MDRKLDAVIENQKRLKIVLYFVIAFMAIVAYGIIILASQFEAITKASMNSDLSYDERLLTPYPLR